MTGTLVRLGTLVAMTGKALTDAEARRDRLVHYANHPDVNAHLEAAVGRARRAYDKAVDELEDAIRGED